MKKRPHEGQILRISDLEVEAVVTGAGSGRNADDNGDCLRITITEVRPEGDRRPSSYSYMRQDGSDQWTDCTGEPVTVELVKDAPKPWRAGYEMFFGELMVAICEGDGLVYPPMATSFSEAVRNHVATEGPGDQWQKLALAALRRGKVDLTEPALFIEHITKLDAECTAVYTKREAFFEKRRAS
jgi:hypothetical protein